MTRDTIIKGYNLINEIERLKAFIGCMKDSNVDASIELDGIREDSDYFPINKRDATYILDNNSKNKLVVILEEKLKALEEELEKM